MNAFTKIMMKVGNSTRLSMQAHSISHMHSWILHYFYPSMWE